MTSTSSRTPTGLGTGLGSMPGVDPAEAVAVMSGETDFAFVPELPARGVGADPVGRTGAVLIDMPFDLVHDSYRLASRPGSVTRRARDLLARDLDALEEHWDANRLIDTGRLLKVHLCGPFTYAAQVELRNGHKLVRDHGARTDVIASMTDGLIDHIRELRRRLGADVVVQLDEPQVEAVLNGSVTPLTRLDAIPPVPVPVVAQRLEEMAAAIGTPMILHTGASPHAELSALLTSYSLTSDMSRPLPDAEKDRMAEFIDGGGVVLAGLVPAVAPAVPVEPEILAQRLAATIDEIGLNRRVLRDNFVVTPTRGLADATPAWAAKALGIASRTAELLAGDPDAL